MWQFSDLRLSLLASPVAFLTTIAIPAHASNLLQPYHSTIARQFNLDDWQLRIERNRFSGEIACRLRSRDHHSLYAGHAVGFLVGKHIDTTVATYRLDSGPVRPWRDQMPELIRLGTAIDGQSLESPTDGFVWLPINVLPNVSSIIVQAQPGRRPKTFHLRGFAGLFDVARAQGCAADHNYVR